MTDASTRDLLIELGCEELPPLALNRLTDAFFANVCDGLEEAGIAFDRADSRAYQSPRRMALLLADVADRQPDRRIERKGPSLAAAFDDQGAPTRAAEGFAASVGRAVDELDRLTTDKGAWLYCEIDEPGKALADVLYPLLEAALGRLPVPRPMRWSDHEFSFVRPVHWLVALHGDQVLPGTLFGCSADKLTRGHRIHAPGDHAIDQASDYLDRLRDLYVLADPEERKRRLADQVEQVGVEAGGTSRITPELLDEVNNIVEWPNAVPCAFDDAFLDVPQEALIASMESHQKFFPILDGDGALTSAFVVVANIESTDVEAMSRGFERVIRPRLADAQFFWEQDLKQPLSRWSEALDGVVFQKDLGTVGDKSKRIATLARKIAEFVGVDADTAEQAGAQCKLDLVSHMVGEFPELQGVMVGYYLARSGASDAVARAACEHYRPRYAGDTLPSTDAGCVVALADRLDTLVGIFAAGLKPTGNKDPFALRRAALGVIRLLEETGFALSVDALLELAAAGLETQLEVSADDLAGVHAFVIERLRNHLLESGATTRQVNAVLAAPLHGIPDLRARLDAVRAFMGREEAESLIAANKRIGNILKKQGGGISTQIDADLLSFDEEKRLYSEVESASKRVAPLFEQGAYADALETLAELREPVDRYFDSVMVMDEDPAVRANRLAQLATVKALFDRVADFSQAD